MAASPPIGMNLSSVTDYQAPIFADAIKQARFWKDGNGNGLVPGAGADANGWPTTDAQVGLWFGALNPRNGTYGLSFTGQAASITVPAGLGTISNVVYNAGTNTTTATVVVPTGTEGGFLLGFTGTKRLPGDTAPTGLTNVKLMRPTLEGGTTPISAGITFTPAYETLCSKFGTIRFMDFATTNLSQVVNWPDRRAANFFTQSAAYSGSPIAISGAWEYAVQLCNEIGKDMWINVPRFATDDYITKVAQLVKYGSDGTNPYTSTQTNPVFAPLNPGLHCYVEYSNENWNFNPYELTALGNSELFGYPVTTNGLAASVTNGTLSSVADHANGTIGPPGQIPNTASVSNPNCFRDVVFNGSTSIFTTQTPASTATDAAGGDEMGMKFKSTTAGQITGLRYYKVAGETGTHVGHLWSYGLDGNQVAFMGPNGGSGGGYFSQSPNFPATGSYTVSYWASNVTGQAAPSVQVSVDGVNVGSAAAPATGFQQYTATFSIGSVGTHSITFTNNSTTATALIDLVAVTGAGTVTIQNNSFESPNLAAGPVPMVTQNVGYTWWAGTSWTEGGGGGAGLTVNGISGSYSDFGSFGRLLGTVTFTGESSSGWQQANFTTAVNISANTTYMVSVNSNTTYGYTNSFQKGPETWDGDMTQAYTRKWVGRAVQMSQIFRNVFGDSAMPGTNANPTIRPVLMMLASGGWIDNYTYNDLHYLQDYFNNQAALTAVPDGAITTAHPPTYYFYGGGGAPYYSPSGSYDVNSVWNTGDWVTSAFTRDWLTKTADYYVPEWGQYISYEGGPQLPDNGALSQQIWSDSRMTGLLTSHQTAYNQNAGGLFVYFSLSDSYQWGFTQDIFVTNTPKLNGIDQINASTQSVSTYGTAIPGTLAASATVPAFSAPNVSNMTATVNHADYAGYVVNVGTAAAFNIGLSAGSASASNQADIYVDGVLNGTISIPNTGSNTTYASSATVATPSLSVGTHGILVKARAGSFGMSAILVTGGTVTVPNPPTGLTAIGTNQQISLSWTGSSGATSYSVYRGTTAGGESGTAIATGIISTSYINTGLTNGTTYYYTVKAVNTAGTSGASNEASATPTSGGTSGPVKINCAGPAVSPFVADVDFSGGTTATNWTGTIDTSAVTSPAPQAVYQSERYGASTYTIGGLTAGVNYQVRLHFCENYFTASAQRTFNVAINGTTVLTNFDIYATAGAIHKANVQQFNATANGSGQEVIALTTVVNNALINGIEINALVSPPAAPAGLTATAGNSQVALSWTASSGATSYNALRSTVSGSGYASAATGIATTSYTNTGLTNGTTYYFVVTATNAGGTSGNSNQASATPAAAVGGLVKINCAGPAVSPFVADADFSGGSTATNWTGTIDTSAVTSPAPQAVYQSERYGAMTYTIGGLTAGTTYTVRLHFCENYFTASGLRVFNVAINGTTVKSSFDIFATAGAIHKANVQQFDVAANSSGQEVIAFTNVTNNALVNGIEITASTGVLVTSVRFFPRASWPQRMTGGIFQGSANNSTWVNLATITTQPADGVWTTLPVSTGTHYRYLRYLSPNAGYGDVAEIEFDNNGTKLNGTGFGTAGSWNNSGNTFDHALDGSTSTFFDAPEPGNGDYVGIDLGS